ncbi:MAG: PD-(D/E)XK nuclease family protein [Byssovorax sp.]
MSIFEALSGLEYMAMADRENVQTGLLAWLLGAHSPLPVSSRVAILTRLSGRELPPVTATMAKTEDQNIDLVIACKLEDGSLTHVALENKLKSTESAHQLNKYDAHLASRCVHAKIFLTLIGENPRGGAGWHAASYADLAGALDATVAEGIDCDPYVRDARAMLHRLVEAVSLVISNPRFASLVFSRGPNVVTSEEASFRRYVETLRLRRLLQRAWCGELGRSLGGLAHGWSTKTGTGARSAASYLHVSRVVGTGSDSCRVGLAVESLVLKAFCYPEPYPKKESADQAAAVKGRLHQIRAALDLGPKIKASSSKGHGFRSYKVLHKKSDAPDIQTWSTYVCQRYQQLAGTPW